MTSQAAAGGAGGGWVGAGLDEFRRDLADLVRRTRSDDRALADLDPVAAAMLPAALLDGPLLHRLVDPGLDLQAARRALPVLFAAATSAGAAGEGRASRAGAGRWSSPEGADR